MIWLLANAAAAEFQRVLLFRPSVRHARFWKICSTPQDFLVLRIQRCSSTHAHFSNYIRRRVYMYVGCGRCKSVLQGGFLLHVRFYCGVMCAAKRPRTHHCMQVMGMRAVQLIRSAHQTHHISLYDV